MYRKMLQIRFFEEKVFELGQNLVPGTIHLYAGEMPQMDVNRKVPFHEIVGIVCTVFLCSGIS